ncbi:MAG: DUF1476 domain-containing protein [Rhodospirillales bacterium]|jgi:hypothetical protein|nr:DUF1476 domain-containing protein [Rhodospirillales bacterium]MDP6773105.1 DUF1476 domain-containing protein [Rhodospirillales bacterium]
MTDKFRERELSEEAKFKLDEERRFKAEARRDKLLGLWAAAKMGMVEAEAEAFAREVVISDLEEPGDRDVVRRVLREFAARGSEIGEDEVRTEMGRLYALALEQLAEEYPTPLGPDHGRVGD